MRNLLKKRPRWRTVNWITGLYRYTLEIIYFRASDLDMALRWVRCNVFGRYAWYDVSFSSIRACPYCRRISDRKRERTHDWQVR